MSWGWKIVVLYTAFVVMTLTMVFYFMRQKVDLVADDYYKQEIEYQSQINKITNARSLREPIGFTFSPKDRNIQLKFPESHITQGIQGEVYLYRPSDADQDKNFDIHPDENGKQVIALGSLRKGMWRVKIYWISAGREYYDEKIITL
ncbi:MAG: FixH family protein [Cytophagales bacterium]|nr:FixH family protein [Cytophagales bacterium]